MYFVEFGQVFGVLRLVFVVRIVESNFEWLKVLSAECVANCIFLMGEFVFVGCIRQLSWLNGEAEQ